MKRTKYQILNSLGQGKFGNVYRGIHQKTGEEVAIKLEPASLNTPHLLKHESTMLHYLYSKSCRDVPPVHWFGEWIHENVAHVGLVMPLYECSLHQWASSYPTAKEDLIPGFMRRILPIYQGIHREGVIHRDVKPQNIMFHRGDWKIIDFGLATFYVDDQFRHIPATTTPHVHLVGTPKYASRNVHDGYDSTRRDDLISLGYVVLFLLYGDRMWDTTRGVTDTRCGYEPTHILYPNNLRLRECKSLENLRPRLPFSLYSYFECVYSLTFSQTPDYTQLVSIWSTV